LAAVSNATKESHAAVWLAGIPYRVGYDRKWGCLLTHRIRDQKALGERHEVEYNLDLVRATGVLVSEPQWRVPELHDEHAEIMQLLLQQGIQSTDQFIAIHPWTSNPIKRWPADRYQVLIRGVVGLGFKVVLIGGPEERGHGSSVIPPGVPVANLTGRLNLLQLAALLQRATMLVSGDSGPVHMAVAMQGKTLVLFGTTDPARGPRRWGPWGAGHAVIAKPSMDAIEPEDVIQVLRQHVRRVPHKVPPTP